MTVRRLPLFLTCTALRSPGQAFCRMSTVRIAWCALLVGLELCVLGGRWRRQSAFVFTSDQGCELSRDLPLWMLTLTTWLRWCVRIIYCKVIFPHMVRWKKVTFCNTHWRSEKFCSPPHWGQSIYIIWNFIPRTFVSPRPAHVIIYLYQMDCGILILYLGL